MSVDQEPEERKRQPTGHGNLPAGPPSGGWNPVRKGGSMAKVTILRGVPGSGKSTLAKSLDGAIVSADNYMTDCDGNYKFDPTRLPYAHGECLSEFMRHMLEWGTPFVTVDNRALETTK